jgi:hypothetical protein
VYDPQRVNRYSYVLNDPINYRDHNGSDEDETNPVLAFLSKIFGALLAESENTPEIWNTPITLLTGGGEKLPGFGEPGSNLTEQEVLRNQSRNRLKDFLNNEKYKRCAGFVTGQPGYSGLIDNLQFYREVL